MIDTNKIVPYEKNAKRHPDNQIDIIASSIDKFKFDQPIVIDENNVIIKGHGRLLGAKRLGLKSVPVIIRTDMTEAEKKASRLADNKSNESDWDWELLNVELDELKDLDIDIDWMELSQGDEGYTDGFALPDGDKEPFQQMTFTLADMQAEEIQSALKIAKQDNKAETFENENSNGNALYRIVSEWLLQRK